MSKVINSKVLTNTLSITECTDGFWLYDETRGMNLSMQAKSEEAAFVEALEYYQERLQEVENDYNNLKAKVDHFIGQVVEDEEDEHYCERCGSYN
ncbi:DUF1033 family protein [Escherichia coli O157]|nr:DUF1033 family protein [Escherichia coli O157]